MLSPVELREQKDYDLRMSDIALVDNGICPQCRAHDLHDGPRAVSDLTQSINLGCFSCNARLNVTLLDAHKMRARFARDSLPSGSTPRVAVLSLETTGTLAPEDRRQFNPIAFDSTEDLLDEKKTL